MLATDSLRSGHLLLLLLVASSVILGFSYLNEMYQRTQIQTDLAIVERQTQRAVSEKLAIQHKAAELHVKLEALKNEIRRLQDVQQFQAQQQTASCDKEKNDLLENISLKDEAINDLRGRYESLKVDFDSIHSVMEQFEKNQSRLLEKFSTQSTQCMNVISMMTELCDKGRNRFRKILPLVKAKNALENAMKKQSVRKPENNNLVPEDPEPKAATVPYIISTTTPSGGKEGSLIDLKVEVNDLSLETIQHKESTLVTKEQALYDNITEQENVSNPKQQPMLSLQDGTFQGDGTVISKKGLNEVFKKIFNHPTVNAEDGEQTQLPYRSVDLDMKRNGSHFQKVNESKENSLQPTHASNSFAEMEEELKERKINNFLKAKNSETMVQEKDIAEKDHVKNLNTKMQNALSSHKDVQKMEKDNDSNTKENKKYNDTIQADNNVETDEKYNIF